MKVYKEEKTDGTLETLTFRAEEESPEQFKSAVKSWLRANYPQLTWEGFFSRLVLYEADRITIRMD